MLDHMTPWRLALLIVALVCFALAGTGMKLQRFDLVPIGLFAVTLAFLLG